MPMPDMPKALESALRCRSEQDRVVHSTDSNDSTNFVSGTRTDSAQLLL